ncbi:hypothetical protein [Microvirga alba]|nr:hypothetical protein [Microvirga alba]
MTKRFALAILAPLGVVTTLAGSAQSADLTAPRLIEPPPELPSWTFRVVPYGWLMGLNGSQTVRGRTTKVNASFIDVAEKADTLVGLMADFEARNGPLALYGDVVWTKVGLSGNHLRTRSLAPGVTGTLGTSVDASTQLGIVEFGAAYEVARLGALGVDLTAGGRYWYQEADLSFDLLGTVGAGDLAIVGGRAIAKSGSVDWLDPVVGGRLRYTIAPGHELFLRGDIGGFNVGSKFSWQAIGGYDFDFGAYQGITFSGIIGYRALYVNYVQGQGRTRYEYDMLQHGPVVGISMKW